MQGKFVTIIQAAKIKNVTRQAIYLAIKLKRLKAYKFNDKWGIFLNDLEDYDQKRYSRVFHSTVDGKPIFDESKGYISVDKASALIAVPKQKLYYAIRTGVLKAVRKKAAYVINMRDLIKYEQRLQKKDYTYKKTG